MEFATKVLSLARLPAVVTNDSVPVTTTVLGILLVADFSGSNGTRVVAAG